MNAREMFEEQGFDIKKSYDERMVTYICIQLIGDYENHYGITFNLESKSYHIWYYGFNKGQSYHNSNLSINAKLHKAIHQQMKELGWLDE